MARPLRIEFEGALYHVTSRGNKREDIYLDDVDRLSFLKVLSDVCQRYNWVCHAYCLMTNHYHLLIETPDANLSAGMRHLNGVYTQRFNYHHGRVGHVFQGRYKGILVEKEAHLLELARYVVLNPVRARMAVEAKDWRWSSYRATSGMEEMPDFLSVDWLLSVFGETKSRAVKAYRQFVSEGKGLSSPWGEIRNQMYLGSDHFVEEMLGKVDGERCLLEIPSAQRRPVAQSLAYYEGQSSDRDSVIRLAYESGGYSMQDLGCYFGLHYSRVSRIINRAKGKTAKGKT